MIFSVRLGTKLFTYSLRRSWRRSLSLKLLTPSSFLISCHHLTPPLLINNFIRDHSSWIVSHSPRLTDYPFLPNLKKLTIIGKNYHVIIKKGTIDQLNIEQKYYSINITTKYLTQTHLQHLISSHLKEHARDLIAAEIARLKSAYNFRYGRFTLRNQRSRFGSCSSRGNLSFNWQIIFFPYPQFRHILCHEIAHLTHPNHSSTFWRLLSTYDPRWRANNLWLKNHAAKVFLIRP